MFPTIFKSDVFKDKTIKKLYIYSGSGGGGGGAIAVFFLFAPDQNEVRLY